MLFPMKTSLFLCLALTALVPARGEIFRSEALRGSHRGDGRRDQGHNHRTSVHVGVGHHRDHHGSPWRHHGWSHGHRGYHYSPYRYVPSFGYYSGYGYGYPYYNDYVYRTGNVASNGLLLGALAGGIIGHNSGEFRHSAWRGAAWGAGIGWLLGSVADAHRRAVAYDSAPVVVQQAPVQVQTQSTTPAQPQQVTIINNYYNSSPMSAANGLFGR
jgi:hypothetical protein